MESNANWIESSLLSEEEDGGGVGRHSQQQYGADLAAMGQDVFVGQAFHSGMVGSFEDSSPSGLQEFPAPHFAQVEQPGAKCANDASVRKVHKADREKLRRDKLNEQFTELASALDPDRPKNDKATILSDSVQELNELRAEVKRLKQEHAALLNESRDLTQEKSELREEKSLLKSETDQLNSQLQQRMRVALSWPVDPSLMLGTAFPYPLPLPAAAPAAAAAAGSPAPLLVPSSSSPAAPPPSSQPQQQQQQPQPPPQPAAQLPPPMPFLPAGLALPGPFGIHPYAMFANRPAGGFFPFFPAPSSTVERPFAHYATPGMHPLRGYTGQDGNPAFFPASLAAEAPYKPIQATAKPPSREESVESVPEAQQRGGGDAEEVGISSPQQVENSSSPPSIEIKQEVQLLKSVVDGSVDVA